MGHIAQSPVSKRSAFPPIRPKTLLKHCPRTVRLRRPFGTLMQDTLRRAANAVRIIRCDETIAVAESGPLCVVIWRGAVTKAPFEWQRSGLSEVVQRHPRGAAFLCIVETTATPPDDELRRAAAQMVTGHGERLKCVAAVIEGAGFKAAIDRGALTAMILLGLKKKSPVSVFAHMHDAVPWMRKHIDLPPTEDLSSTVESIRARLPPIGSNR
jgi:hypothetical protein